MAGVKYPAASRPFPGQNDSLKNEKTMRRLIISLLLALPMLATAQQAEPFSPPAGLHPHSQVTQHEILGDGELSENTSTHPAAGFNDTL